MSGSSELTTAGASSSPGELDVIAARHGRDPSRLLPILQDVMAAPGFVARAAISELGRLLGISRGQVEGVVGFHSFFASQRRGDLILQRLELEVSDV